MANLLARHREELIYLLKMKWKICVIVKIKIVFYQKFQKLPKVNSFSKKLKLPSFKSHRNSNAWFLFLFSPKGGMELSIY